ncbi:MAG: EF-hand domain-containing protein [Burkholderiales bacterium]
MKTSVRPDLLIVALAALLPAAAFAQPDAGRAAQMQAELQKRFVAADANADGQLTRDEANGKMTMVYKHFDDIDSAHKGVVTLADIRAYAIAQRAAGRAAKQ